jgi:RNA polymerase sigma factor (sigma-70 family)
VEKKYYIKLDGERVPVAEEVYRAYQQPKWREKKQAEVRAKKEVSLDAMLESGSPIHFDLGQALIEDIVVDKLLLEDVVAAFMKLTDGERSLLYESIYIGKSERDIAQKMGISSVAVHKRKHKAIEKLKHALKSK